ncbi:lantibiotic dehydratase, partial [Stackebrandtia soli]|uniref:lantibiotic dehydratase n=1 Tax=Stackebrandtia soli TaxID=1892856 RepID=UPI0039E7578A
MVDHYALAGPLLARVAPWPAGSLPTIPDIDPGENADAAPRLLAESIKHPSFMAALWAASPDTARAVTTPTASTKPDRLALTVSRYALRARSRATPFGTFAGVSIGRFDDEAAWRLGTDHRRLIRADGAWTDTIAAQIEQNDPHATVMAHPLRRVRGNRVTLPTTPDRETSIRANPLVTALLHRA